MDDLTENIKSYISMTDSIIFFIFKCSIFQTSKNFIFYRDQNISNLYEGNILQGRFISDTIRNMLKHH